jgi:hypothetical protein
MLAVQILLFPSLRSFLQDSSTDLPANYQLNCSAISSQPPLQDSTINWIVAPSPLSLPCRTQLSTSKWQLTSRLMAKSSLHRLTFNSVSVNWQPTTNWVRVRVTVNLRREVYRKPVRLGEKPLRITTSNFIFQLNIYGFSPYVTSSLTRGWVCRLQLLLILANAVILSRVPRDSWRCFTVSNSRLPQPEWPGPVCISPRNNEARLYPQALGSLFVASYGSQGYGGNIGTRLHTG